MKVLRVLVFINSSHFQIWYLEKLIFMTIERELHVSTPYEFLNQYNMTSSNCELQTWIKTLLLSLGQWNNNNFYNLTCTNIQFQFNHVHA